MGSKAAYHPALSFLPKALHADDDRCSSAVGLWTMHAGRTSLPKKLTRVFPLRFAVFPSHLPLHLVKAKEKAEGVHWQCRLLDVSSWGGQGEWWGRVRRAPLHSSTPSPRRAGCLSPDPLDRVPASPPMADSIRKKGPTHSSLCRSLLSLAYQAKCVGCHPSILPLSPLRAWEGLPFPEGEHSTPKTRRMAQAAVASLPLSKDPCGFPLRLLLFLLPVWPQTVPHHGLLAHPYPQWIFPWTLAWK